MFSHETALMLHDLSDALPAKASMTLPSSWSKRRLRVPPHLVLYFAEVPKVATSSLGSIALTTPLRTVTDCVTAHVAEDFVRQAVEQGLRRELFSRAEINAAVKAAARARDASR